MCYTIGLHLLFLYYTLFCPKARTYVCVFTIQFLSSHSKMCLQNCCQLWVDRREREFHTKTARKNNKYIVPFGAGYVCHFSHKLPNNIWSHFIFFSILCCFAVFRLNDNHHCTWNIWSEKGVREEAQHFSHWMKIHNTIV